MKLQIKSTLILLLALGIIVATVFHTADGNISFFHGIVMHSLFFLGGIALLGYAVENWKKKKISRD